MLTEHDIYLFKEGNHFALYNKLGAHPVTLHGVKGTHFAVWAPNGAKVSVIGDFNGWNADSHPLNLRPDGSGIWEGFLPGIDKGTVYKYHIFSRHNNYRVDKTDPFGFYAEVPPKTASIVWDLGYEWHDAKWMKKRRANNSLHAPHTVYEVHPGSWKRPQDDQNRFLTYRELAESLADYVKEAGFTHVEFLPVMEHPFYASWGYQTVGYFSPTSRYGTPQDFMYLVDHLHQKNIGVILDWVPSHFPGDVHGLVYFDGTHLFEHADPRKGFHPDWNSYIFNYGRREVCEFLISSALFWLEKYHVDSIRVDAIASMLYLDYSRKEGEWIPNQYGGKENVEAIDFIRKFNQTIYGKHPDVQTIAEESTSWSMVSRPTSGGGLGFGMKWNMGWMHDTLEYMSNNPFQRKHHHNQLTFGMWYAFYENFVLSFSHDEVVHGKGSLIGKMPGDDWQKFANLRLLYGYMYGYPGKKLLFMGDEIAQRKEWNHDTSLEWHLLQYPPHQGMHDWVKELNRLYRKEKALYELDFESAGYEWIDFSDWEQSIISFIRKGKTTSDIILVACNFTPMPRHNYRIGVPRGDIWNEILNSDASVYGGSGIGNPGPLQAELVSAHGREFSIPLTLPPLGVIFLKSVHQPYKEKIVETAREEHRRILQEEGKADEKKDDA